MSHSRMQSLYLPEFSFGSDFLWKAVVEDKFKISTKFACHSTSKYYLCKMPALAYDWLGLKWALLRAGGLYCRVTILSVLHIFSYFAQVHDFNLGLLIPPSD